jgi:hypothetical protein
MNIGPLTDESVVSKHVLATTVRQTAIAASILERDRNLPKPYPSPFSIIVISIYNIYTHTHIYSNQICLLSNFGELFVISLTNCCVL